MSFKKFLTLYIILPLAESFQGTNATKWYKKIKDMNTWSALQIKEWQNAELQKFIEHAYNHTIFYRNLFNGLGLKPSDIQCIEDLKKIPAITKDIIRGHHDELIPDNISSFHFRKSKSGGTTGIPMHYYCDENTWGYVTAAKIYYWRKNGYHYGQPFIALGSTSLFSHKAGFKRRIYDIIRNERPLNCVDLTEAKCEKYVEYIKKHEIKYLYGYAAAIYILTKYVSEHKIDLSQVEIVFTTSENLIDEYRNLIQNTYNCKVVDCYGAKDAGITAYETDYHNYCVGYNCIVETINEFEHDAGTALSTNFLNYSFPLIRYQFGDEIMLGSSNNYNGQIIKKIYGRTSDVMRLENGTVLTSTGISMIMKAFDIKAFEFRKSGTNEVTLTIAVIPDIYNDEQENTIYNTLKNYTGNNCSIILKYVDDFKPLKNGKRQYFIV